MDSSRPWVQPRDQERVAGGELRSLGARGHSAVHSAPGDTACANIRQVTFARHGRTDDTLRWWSPFECEGSTLVPLASGREPTPNMPRRAREGGREAGERSTSRGEHQRAAPTCKRRLPGDEPRVHSHVESDSGSVRGEATKERGHVTARKPSVHVELPSGDALLSSQGHEMLRLDHEEATGGLRSGGDSASLVEPNKHEFLNCRGTTKRHNMSIGVSDALGNAVGVPPLDMTRQTPHRAEIRTKNMRVEHERTHELCQPLGYVSRVPGLVVKRDMQTAPLIFAHPSGDEGRPTGQPNILPQETVSRGHHDPSRRLGRDEQTRDSRGGCSDELPRARLSQATAVYEASQPRTPYIRHSPALVRGKLVGVVIQGGEVVVLHLEVGVS